MYHVHRKKKTNRSGYRKNKRFKNNFFLYKFNPLMSGSDKSSHTQTNLKLSAVGLFKYV